MAKIRDFTELGTDYKFKFKGKEFTIPAITQETSEKLAEVAEKMRERMDEQDFVGANRAIFEYVCVAMASEHDEKEVAELPKKVISAVMDIIANEMQGLPEKMTKEERKAAKK